MRVLIGVNEISNNIATFAEALREAGHEATTVVASHPGSIFYRGNRYDHEIPLRRGARGAAGYQARMAARWLREVPRHDVFVYVWMMSYLPKQLDLLLLRLLRRPVVVFYCGDEIRYRPIQADLNRALSAIPPHPHATPEAEADYRAGGLGFWQTLWSTKLAERSGCHIVAARDETTFQARPYFVFRFPQRRLAPGPKPPSPEPLVVHAPSDSFWKGTAQVEAAVERLRAEGVRFRFALIRDMPNEIVLARLREADVVIDQPGVWIARLAAEGLASGCAVVGGNQPSFWGAEDTSPVLQFEPDADRLADTLRPLLTNQERRGELMAASYEFWRTTLSYGAWERWFESVVAGEARRFDALPDQREFVLKHLRGQLRRAAVRLVW